MSGGAAKTVLDGLARRHAVDAKVMIIVAHPDDETIGIGAQLCQFRDALLMQVTDGAPRNGSDAAAHGFRTTADYASARSLELRAALEAGEAHGVQPEILGIPDQEVCLNLVSLTVRIAAQVRADRPEVIFVQPYEGGHPDHDAASFATRVACRLIEAETGSAPALIEMTGYHRLGAELETGEFLPSHNPVTALTLSAAEQRRKCRMIDCFVSQRDLLTGFGTGVERFREAPDYDFTQPPHPGELHYERLGWDITGALWRREAQSALERLGLGAARWA
jgi:LmbE family N-acetylglucosaminyl deacetylase